MTNSAQRGKKNGGGGGGHRAGFLDNRYERPYLIPYLFD